MRGDKTNIQITVETRDRLLKIGRKGESYDAIIRRLLEREKKKEASKG